MNILDQDLSFNLQNSKYYITLAGKQLKTKQGNYVYCDSLKVVKKIQQDYKRDRFKSKWINLVSSFVDFENSDSTIEVAKQMLISYLKNDYCLYPDIESSELEKIKTDFCKRLQLNNLDSATGFEKINICTSDVAKFNKHLDNLSLKQLFIAQFLTKMSTSSILALSYIEQNISLKQFYENACAAELKQQKLHPDSQVESKLAIINQELEILEFFLNI